MAGRIGGDWGADGFTTMDQADTLARELGLSAADRLLDLGTGRGWPGLYLAAIHAGLLRRALGLARTRGREVRDLPPGSTRN